MLPASQSSFVDVAGNDAQDRSRYIRAAPPVLSQLEPRVAALERDARAANDTSNLRFDLINREIVALRLRLDHGITQTVSGAQFSFHEPALSLMHYSCTYRCASRRLQLLDHVE